LSYKLVLKCLFISIQPGIEPIKVTKIENLSVNDS